MSILDSVIFPAMDEIKATLGPGVQFEKSPETKLFGKDSALDSLNFVAFIVAVEERILEVYDVQVSLVDEKAMSLKSSPFRTIGSLQEHVERLVASNA